MADLSNLDAAQTVKLAGADSAGSETNFVNASGLGELQTSDVITGAGSQAALSIGTSATEAKVGGSALTNRKLLTVFNNSNSTVYWGRSAAVTTSNGTPIFKQQLMTFDFAADAPLYLIAGSAGNDVRITESV
jgi:hypothetical protein